MAKLVVVDVEADGEIPCQYNMVCFGAVVVDKAGKLDQTFYGQTRPLNHQFKPEALAVSGFTREQHEKFPDSAITIPDFKKWILSQGNCIFISDNLAFDWQWINWYLHYFTGSNPFGFSGQRIGDKFQGFFNDPYYKWKRHRDSEKYPHNHDPISDAKGNASALLYLYKSGYKLF